MHMHTHIYKSINQSINKFINTLTGDAKFFVFVSQYNDKIAIPKNIKVIRILCMLG